MFELICSIIWSSFVGLFTFIMIWAENSPNVTKTGNTDFAYIIIGLFWIVGSFMFIRGIKKIIANRKTELYGEECFGKIINIYPTGNKINGQSELAANVMVNIHSHKKTEVISESLGLRLGTYKIGDFVKIKYYNGDINIQEKTEDTSIPLSIKEKIDVPVTISKYDKLVSSEFLNENEDEIIINGVKYKKVDK